MLTVGGCSQFIGPDKKSIQNTMFVVVFFYFVPGNIRPKKKKLLESQALFFKK